MPALPAISDDDEEEDDNAADPDFGPPTHNLEFCPSSPPTFNIAETSFKHQNVQLGRESMALTFIIHNFHNSRDTSHNTSHF